MPVILQKFIHRSDLKKNPTIHYLFGDNELRVGSGGQAREMRGEPNAIGVRTKKLPGNDANSYWYDKNYKANCHMIDEDMSKAFISVSEGGVVIIPADGLGTGLAKLDIHAPKTLEYLNECLELLLNFEEGIF